MVSCAVLGCLILIFVSKLSVTLKIYMRIPNVNSLTVLSENHGENILQPSLIIFYIRGHAPIEAFPEKSSSWKMSLADDTIIVDVM